MIELTLEQVQALGPPSRTSALGGTFPAFGDSQLAAGRQYRRLNEAADDDGSWTDEERDALRWEACQLLDSFGKDK